MRHHATQVYRFRRFAVLAPALIAMLLCGCSNRGFYDGLRANAERECLSHPSANQSQCRRESGLSYADYQVLRAGTRKASR